MLRSEALRLLALDTSTPRCGVAVYDVETGRASVRREEVTTHSDRLLWLVDACLRECGWGPADLAAVACGAGPGSFTGLRIGVSTAKGLCFALGLPLLMISSLQVLAEQHRGAAPWILACLDAWGGQVYAQLFPAPPAALADPRLARPAAWDPGALREALQGLGNQVAVCGTGVLRHPWLGPPNRLPIDRDPWPDPVVLAQLAARRLQRGERDDLARAAPEYICPSAAEMNTRRG
ncbi:MAG: tRNA (adenosine(37)-N6)-threonylcarbamoyltransferase complex dimerization subunit type 1 TsaB [Myxococcales bacterium]|nr:tRNA (adenosine(37)-N6)-threonylcarbamoyltransferase complex dimerization subunit type 1 TsaB [Myxococcota bacterium]MDW8281360.1 tRNA (adenosine(37)-N6)-threonylcarbamoyltransferase complex dimerization subunit type 1 TsaB [Myxococcales bacterium]